MADYVTLMGAEQVQSAAMNMRSAAEQMSRAASQIDEAMSRHQRFMDDWLMCLEAIISNAPPAPVN